MCAACRLCLQEGVDLRGGESSQLLCSCSNLAKGSSGEGAAPGAHDSALLWMKSLSSESKLYLFLPTYMVNSKFEFKAEAQ